MPDEQEKTILTQKIRDPREGQENPWIEVFKIKVKDIDSSPAIYTNSIITNNNMYKGNDTNKKPVSTETIQLGAIKNAAMYQPSDEDINDPKKNINQKDRPVSTDTIQDGAITTSKISPNFINEDSLQHGNHVKIFGSNEHKDYKITFFYTSASSELSTI